MVATTVGDMLKIEEQHVIEMKKFRAMDYF